MTDHKRKEKKKRLQQKSPQTLKITGQKIREREKKKKRKEKESWRKKQARKEDRVHRLP